ncbi:hypothetical protein PFICI_07792 [Pestalotiopsis fici W106-1]|uniref:Condensation domain-containing protein n=1 Tax=Pestalotiopsis fici (strain W106-1 / CGMCC3.15140) TaxID=1229662 RepID=W3X2B5_PESFW|nr:uncharacterized protein PFICI_07792 [Pestalotiopsis fici W106-1]ETS80263.1 hypothetical protein PFICI_07792 [Pestalotiopsis fici W106-1]
MPPANRVKCHPSWKQTAPNVYTQPYGFQEVLYNAISVPPGSPGLFLIGTHVTFNYQPSSPSNKLTHDDLAARLRQAWLQTRQQYPTLAAENRPEGKTYTSPSSMDELEAWLATTFIVIPKKTSAEHWKTMVKTRQMTLYYFPEESQLFIQGEHHILDGRGAMNFWDRFFKNLASVSQLEATIQTDGSEISRLPPRSDDLLDLTEKKAGRGEARALEILAPLLTMSAPIYVPVAQPIGACSPRNAAFELKLSARTTASIVAACKAQRLSVTAAWHVAVVLATQAVQAQRNAASQPGNEARAGTQFAAFGNFDLRRYFPAAVDESLSDVHALSNHHGVLPYVFEPGNKTFSQMVHELAAFYQQDLPQADAEIWSALGPMIRMMVPEFTKTPLEETTPALSSLGVVDSFIASSYADADGKGVWHIRDVWFGDTVTGPWLECFMWAWQGRLSMNTCYNPAYYSYAEVDEFLQLVGEKLLEGLGIGDREPGSKL